MLTSNTKQKPGDSYCNSIKFYDDFFSMWKLSSSAFPLFIEQGLQFEHYTKMSLIIWQITYKLTKYLNILKEKSMLHINLLASPSLLINLHMKQDVISLIVSVGDKRKTL